MKKLIAVLAVPVVPAVTACKSAPTEPDPDEEGATAQVVVIGAQLG